MFCLLGFIYSLHFLKDQIKLWEFDWILDFYFFKLHALKNQFFKIFVRFLVFCGNEDGHFIY